MAILKLAKHDPKKELEFDVKCSLERTQADRLRQLFNLSEHILKLAKKYEYRRPYQIIKRAIPQPLKKKG